MDLADSLFAFFARRAPLEPGDGVIAAFSGGSDSTALLWGLARAAERFPFRIWAVHLDHGLDDGSAERARGARRLAEEIGVPWICERRAVPALRRRGESAEEAARRVRYGFLAEVRQRLAARWVATAHHRDDQAETVALRLAFGSGLAGLGGIAEVSGHVVRPLLTTSKAQLASVVFRAGLLPLDDPTNRDLAAARNRIRHLALPRLAAGEDPGELCERLARLAGRAAGAAAALERRWFPPAERLADGALAIPRAALAALPEELRPLVLAALHRRAGAPYPPSRKAREELAAQLLRGAAGCDCGAGWRWQSRGPLLALRPPEPEDEPSPRFSYTLAAPGTVAIPELGLRMTLARRAVEPWMAAGHPLRAGLALPLVEGQGVTVRNRRPGDRIHPLGGDGSRRLKEVLIDRRVPRGRRDRIPLLVVEGTIAWVPGVTVAERFRLAGETEAWASEIETL